MRSAPTTLQPSAGASAASDDREPLLPPGASSEQAHRVMVTAGQRGNADGVAALLFPSALAS